MDRFSPIDQESNNESKSQDNEDEQMTPHIGDESYPIPSNKKQNQSKQKPQKEIPDSD